eukprot:958_1
MSDLVILVSITVVTLIFVSSIYTIVQIHKFKSIMDTGSEFFQIRDPTLTVSCIIGFLCVFYVFNPCILVLSNIFHVSRVCLYLIQITDSIISLLIFPRAVIYCFDRLFIDHLRNWIWRREINPNDTNFFIKYRGILQHAHVIILVASALIVIPLFFILHMYSQIALIICISALYAITLYLAHNINAVTDEYSVKPEVIASVTSTGGLHIIVHVVHYICFHVISSPFAIHWGVIVHIVLNSAITIIALYYACIWTTNQLLCVGLVPDIINNYGKRIRFKDIMDDRVGLESFCNHLSREFGLESILFLIEVARFKSIIHASKREIVDNICDIVHIDYSDTFAAVNIVKSGWLPIDPRMHTQTPYQLALNLYDKYIEENADLCINISYLNRNTIYREFQSLAQINMDHLNATTQTAHFEALYEIFDGAFSEIWRLINMDSYARYRVTKEYRRLEAVLQNNRKTDAKAKSTWDLKVHVQKMDYNARMETVPPVDSPATSATPPGSIIASEKEETLSVVSDLCISIDVERTEPFKDLLKVHPLKLMNSHSLPNPHSQTRFKQPSQEQNHVHRLSLPMSSFDAQNLLQRAESLKSVSLGRRVARIQLPPPTTYRFMIQSARLNADPSTPGLYSINETDQTKHLTPRPSSLSYGNQMSY